MRGKEKGFIWPLIISILLLCGSNVFASASINTSKIITGVSGSYEVVYEEAVAGRTYSIAVVNQTFLQDSEAVITTSNLVYATQIEATASTITKNIYMPGIGDNIYTVVLGDNVGSELKIIGYLTEKVIVAVEGVSLDYSKKTISNTDTTALVSTVYPENATNKDVLWTSDNTSVAVVDETGLVTAMSNGVANITVTTVDGTHTASCQIKVNDDGIDRDDHYIEADFVSGMPDDYLQVNIYLRNNTGLTDLDLSINYDKTALYLNKCQEGSIFDSYSKSTISKMPFTISCSSEEDPQASENDIVASLFFYVERSAVEGNSYPISVTVTKAKSGDENISLPVVNGGGLFTCERVVPVTIPVTGIEMSSGEETVYVGETVELAAVVSPDNATDTSVVWSSNNEAVATVDENGTVTGISEGVVTITATTNGVDGSGAQLNARCRVTVEPAPILPVAVTDVRISSSSASIIVDDGTFLTATVSPQDADDKSVTWSSDDEAVATVDENGFVRGVSEGNAHITVTTNDGGFTASCLVSVYPKPVPDLDPDDFILPEPNTDTVIAVGTVTGVSGRTVEVPVVISDNAGIEGAQIDLYFDKDALTLKGAQAGSAMTELEFIPSGDYGVYPFKLTWLGPAECTSNGTIVTLTFEIADETKAGDHPVKLKYEEGHIYNHNLDNINPHIVQGSVNVMEYMPGDINGDNAVTIKDVTFLRRHIAGGYNITVVEQALDVNRDGGVDIKDATILRRFIAGGYGIVLR